MHKAINLILENTDYNISIRPHPHETLDPYYKYVLPSFNKFKNRIEVDVNLFIPEWIASQKYIVSTTTTTFVESYVMKTPMINLDFISSHRIHNGVGIGGVIAASCDRCVISSKNFDDFIKLVKKRLSVKKDKKIERQLEKNCNFN